MHASKLHSALVGVLLDPPPRCSNVSGPTSTPPPEAHQAVSMDYGSGWDRERVVVDTILKVMA